jgi:hypothetical protein
MHSRKIASAAAALTLLGALGGGATGALAAAKTTPKATTAKIGGVCKKRGSKVKLKNGKTLKCTRVGKKLVYR